MTKLERASFGSKLGVILATAGSAVGLGNIWRFPYMTGQNGGAIFIIIYVFCILLLGIPCMISEFIIGRHGQANTARAFRIMSGDTIWSLIGYMGVLTGFLISGYYAVVSGWCLEYVWASLSGKLLGNPDYIQSYFVTFSQDSIKPVFWTFIILLATYIIIENGVRNGIEKASKLMMPILFILLLIIVVASCMLPNAEKGIEFLFKPDISKLNSDVFLAALGQSFYSLSIAMGCICTYASYYSKQTNLTPSPTPTKRKPTRPSANAPPPRWKGANPPRPKPATKRVATASITSCRSLPSPTPTRPKASSPRCAKAVSTPTPKRRAS